MNHAEKVARARQAASRKKGKLKKKPKRRELDPEAPAAQPESQEQDSNAVLLVPKSKDEKEAERRERIKQEVAAQADSKWNAKKKKRLEKYIASTLSFNAIQLLTPAFPQEKKLKKEERVQILEKLAQTQAEIPSSLHLKSSAFLGTGKAITHQERFDQAEDKEVRRALGGQSGQRKRHNDFAITHPDSGEETSDEEPDLVHAGHGDHDQVETSAPGPTIELIGGSVPAPAEQMPVPAGPTMTTIVGSALQRNPDGTVVAPKVGKKRGKKDTFGSWKDVVKRKQQIEADSDTSFDSSDSAYDSSEEEFSGIQSDSENEGDEDTEGNDGSDDAEEEEESPANTSPTKKKLGFKDWALKQLNTAKGYEPTTHTDLMSESRIADSEPPAKKRKIADPSQKSEMRGPLGVDLTLPNTTFAQRLGPQDASTSNKTKTNLVKRPPDVEEARILLPIVTEEQPIMEAILLNPVVIICGETGSGKTTQVPQFLYEAGFGVPGSDNPGMIGVTQPRRVAAMSMAARVAHELSLTSSHVSYQIRYDATVSPNTSIKFMTDGVLLRELATDFLLSKYSVIIIDEAHERSMNTDILIGVLSRVLKLRENLWKEGKDGAKPLRLIIMSATLRVSDFAENRNLFPTPPPVINVAARQHPVTVHFSKRTSADYVTEAIKKTVKIHTRLPPGGILIFLTGQNEITGVCRKLEARFGSKAIAAKKRKQAPREQTNDIPEDNVRSIMPSQADIEAEDLDLGEQPEDLALDVDEDMEEDPDALDTDTEDELDEQLGLFAQEADMPMHVVPLYSLLASEKQMRVFQPPPEGSRLVVVATNVAETSLTIPGIRYVVDCGRAKERRCDTKNGIQAFVVSWISKASAAQRAGRAGRTGPGHCYRLYSSALFEHHFDQFALPEINRMPIEGVVLQMKSMHIDAVVNFPFPTPPDQMTLRQAEKTLTHLGALSNPSLAAANSTGGQITPLGKTLALFPLSPRFSRMLVNGQQHGCLPYVISIVAALSVGDPFFHDEAIQQDAASDEEADSLSHLTSERVKAKEAQRLQRKAFFESQALHASLGQSSSDIFKILSVVGAYEFAGGGYKFCEEHFVRPKAMEEIHKLRAQINNIVQSNFPTVGTGFSSALRPPNALQLKVLKQLLTAGFIDQVAIRRDRVMDTGSSGTQFTTSKGVPYRAIGISEDVFIHPSSVIAGVSPPEYVVFTEVVRTTRIWLKGVTVVNPSWLASLGKPSLCTFSKPTKNMAGIMMTIPRFGPEGWELPPIKADVLQK